VHCLYSNAESGNNGIETAYASDGEPHFHACEARFHACELAAIARQEAMEPNINFCFGRGHE
jgi:hypothetical protein